MSQRIKIKINKWLNLEGFPEGTITGQVWNQLEFPPCPVCGTTIDVDRIDITSIDDFVGSWGGRSYVPGLWRCPNECDPRGE